jgi:hypothetical protein
MKEITGVAYDPPRPDLPILAVVFADTEVPVARAVESVDAGEELIRDASAAVSSRTGTEVKVS